MITDKVYDNKIIRTIINEEISTINIITTKMSKNPLLSLKTNTNLIKIFTNDKTTLKHLQCNKKKNQRNKL